MRILAALLTFALAFAASGEGADTAVADAIAARIKDRQLAEAAADARAALAQLDASGGGESIDAARLLDLYVEASWRGGLTDGATREDGERAVRIRQRLSGPVSAELATSLHLLANLLQGRGDLVGARALYERSLAIREEVFGPDALEVVPSLNNLGNITRALADLPASVRYLERALAVREKRLAPDDPNLVRSYVSLGNTLREREQFDRAEELLRRAVEILERGEPGEALASASNTLSLVLIRRGEYEEAERLSRRAVEVQESVAEDTYLAMYLGNLAVVRRDRGDLAEARRIQERALRVYQAHPGPDEAWLGLLWNNLGHLFLVSGDPHGAEEPLERAIEIRRRALPAGHPDIAQTLTNLGHVRLQLGDVAGARGFYAEAASIVEARRGSDHLDFAEALIDLGQADAAAGDAAQALERFRRALAIAETRLGAEAPLTATALYYRGTTELQMERVEEAGRTLGEALARRERALGPAHPQVAQALAALALARAARGDRSGALDLALRVERLGVDHVRLNLRVLPERQALALAASRPSGADVALSIAARSREPGVAARVWDAVLRSRALVLDELVRRNGAPGTPNEASARLTADLAEARSRLVRLHLAHVVPERAAEHGRALAEARREKERIEQALAEVSSAFREERRASEAGWTDVAAALPTGAALVAYASFEDVLDAAGREIPRRFLAFVAAPDRTEPTIVPLGPTRSIDDLVAAWRREVTAPAIGGARPGSEARCRAAGEALRRAVWDPVRDRLGRVRQVLVVPAERLNLVNLGALPVGSRDYLVESGPMIHLLTAERDVLRHTSGTGTGLLALGAPDFDLGLDGVRTARAAAPGAADERGVIDEMLPRLRAAAARFEPLPGAAAEASRVAAIWRRAGDDPEAVAELTGAAATETAFKAGAAGRLGLHLATHGFFLQPDPARSQRAGDGSGVVQRWRAGPRPIAADNPLLMAGVALAGANRRLAGEAAAGDDGLLLAEEIAALDLSGVDWVVFSGCETGIGEIVYGEGVSGLRRAAVAAGAGSVVMSLWQVDDEPTTEWMDRLYRARLEGRRSTVEAVTRATREVIAERRDHGESTHPFYWGAFVAAGDWR